MQIVGCSQIFLISRTATNLSNFSLVLQWQGHLIKALHSMNAGDLADQALRQIDRAEWAEQDCASKDPWLVNVSDKYYSRTLVNNPSILRTSTPPRWITIPLGSMPGCDWTVVFSEGWSELCWAELTLLGQCRMRGCHRYQHHHYLQQPLWKKDFSGRSWLAEENGNQLVKT